MEKVHVLTKTIAQNDYYEKNNWGKTLAMIPIYFFDLDVLKYDKFLITLTSANSCLIAKRIIVVAPNGRVIVSNKNKSEIQFTAELIGKYVIKMWIHHSCDGYDKDKVFEILKNINTVSANLYDDKEKESHLEKHHALFKFNIFSYTSSIDTINHDTTKIRPYSLLGSHKEGALHKETKIKEKCSQQPKIY